MEEKFFEKKGEYFENEENKENDEKNVKNNNNFNDQFGNQNYAD